jgi:hypothetical protein
MRLSSGKVKALAALLLFVLVLAAAPARALALDPGFADEIGGEDALERDLSGTVAQEKAGEVAVYDVLSTAAIAASAPGAVFAGLSQLAEALEKYAYWSNWPMDRYNFSYVPPEGGILGGIDDKVAAAVGAGIANFFFSLAKLLARIGINLTVAAFHTNVVSGLAGWIGDAVRRIFSLADQPFMQVFLKLMAVALLLGAAYKLIRGRIASAVLAVAVAAAAVGGSMWFAANAGRVVRAVGDFTDGLAGLALSAVGSFSAEGRQTQGVPPLDRGLIVAANEVWATVIAKPWALATFGTADPEKLKLTGPDDPGKPAGAVSEYEYLEEAFRDSFPDFSKVRPGMRADTLYLGTAPGTPERQAAVQALGASEKGGFLGLGRRSVWHGDHPGSAVGLSPGSVWGKIPLALLSLLAALAYFALAVSVGGSILFCQLALAVLIVALPLALLALLWPDAGYSFAAKYARTLLGFLAVKLIYGIYLALVLAVASAVVSAAG